MAQPAEDWQAGWQRMVDAVGREFDDAPLVFRADRIEASAVRRYLEPLEFDCALHHDAAFAREHGYADIVVPASALPTFAMVPMWAPGQVLFDDEARNAQPAKTAVTGIVTGLEPPTTG